MNLSLSPPTINIVVIVIVFLDYKYVEKYQRDREGVGKRINYSSFLITLLNPRPLVYFTITPTYRLSVSLLFFLVPVSSLRLPE